MKRKTTLERLTSNISVDDNGCWIWQRFIMPNGYGYMHLNARRMEYTHRVSYALHVGEIPAGADIDHLCRVRSCCNPAHLEAVSRRTNLMRGDTLTRAHSLGVNCGHSKCPNCRRFRKVPA